VLSAFFNGDADYPVIVGILPNTEAPSVLSSNNAREHVLRTPGGCEFVITDGGDGSSTEGADGQPVTQDESEIRLATPMTNAKLTLGGGVKAQTGGSEQGVVGFDLRTDYSGEIYAGKSLLIEVPGHYRVAAGGTERDTLTNFLGSEETLAPGVAAEQSGGVVFENFTGAKVSTAESSVTEVTVGHSTEVFAGLKMDALFALGASVKYAPSKEFDLAEKRQIVNAHDLAGRNFVMRFLKSKKVTAETSHETVQYKLKAHAAYKLDSLSITLEAGVNAVYVTPSSVALKSANGLFLEGKGVARLQSDTQVLVRTGAGAKLQFTGPAVNLQAAGPLTLKGKGAVDLNAAGGVIKIG